MPVLYAVPEDITNTEVVGENIEDTFEDFNAITDLELSRQVGQMVNNIRFFTVGIAAIAAIVGGLGVMNTMIMAVLERRREIGLMKALGATNRMIMTQFLTESALLALIGGIGGLVLGTQSEQGGERRRPHLPRQRRDGETRLPDLGRRHRHERVRREISGLRG